MRYRLPNGQTIDASQAFTLGEGEDALQFPPFAIEVMSPEDLERFGISIVNDPSTIDPSAP